VTSGLLYGISATDPRMYAAMCLVLLLVAIAATLVPAMRAARTDPVSILRGE
jgi:ABC-type lipoprotein release transport system permease subunit